MSVSIKLKFRPSKVEGREGALFFQIICQRVSYQYTTGYKVLQYEWDGRKSAIIMLPKSNPRHDAVATIRKRVRWEMAALTRFANRMIEDDECTTVDEILELWMEKVSRHPFFVFMQLVVDKLQADNKLGTAEKYMAAKHSFERFIGGKDLMLFEVCPELVEGYQRWLVNNGVAMNTVSFYMRILRAVFNRAVKQRLVSQNYPFADVYTGVAETKKRAVGLDTIQRIKDVNLEGDANMELARDLFLFSFYCRGMAFVDMAYLTKDSICNGYLTYTRHKTKQLLAVKWEAPMQEIVDKYENDGQYLLPILETKVNRCQAESGPVHFAFRGEKEDVGDQSKYWQYKRMNKNVCRWLKIVGKKAGVNTNITIYVARHSWSSIAKQRNCSISTISKALGHNSEKTTQIYLASLDNSAVDDANNDILSGLR